MWDFSIRQSLGLMGRTLPFILLRMAVYFGITLGYILSTGAGVGLGWGIGAFGDEGFRANATMWGGFAGFGLFGAFLYWAREYILYLVKAGHIAVLVALIDGEAIPQGRSQVQHAQAEVRQRFPQASALFVLDQLVKGVIRAISGLVRGLLTVLPIPGAQQLATILSAFLRVAVGFVDEVILAHAIRTRSDNAWLSAREALVLYGQNWRPMLRNAAWLAVIVYALSFAVFLLMLAPAALLVWMMPGAWAAGGVVFALLFAWSVKAALLEPFAIACMMQVFFRTTAGQRPNPEWEAKLEQMSGPFRKLKERVMMAPAPMPAPAAAAPTA